MRSRVRGVVLTLEFEASDRLLAAAEEWGNRQMKETDEALESKVEQALLEIENLVSGATEVDFEIEGATVRHHPSDDLEAFLEAQTEDTELSPSELLAKHVDLFATVFLDNYGDDVERPPNAPPVE
ncbi:hypothetical protein [Halospeciosus flavus]|uniref:hypothetical protein n=1 Tax=Halospeciosus flavus TaxID=3032283 RepID=UPI00360E8966